jgi:hypothetical protein
LNKLEAAALVTMLVNAYPTVRFTGENAELYERGIMDLGAREAQGAIEELVRSSRFLPSVAEIRGEVIRVRRAAATLKYESDISPKRLLGDGQGDRIAPPPDAWAGPLSRMLEAEARHRAMAAKWNAERGRKPPDDPGAEFTKIASEAASGADVRARVRQATAIGEDDSERRYP